jgi:hypothetical protein
MVCHYWLGTSVTVNLLFHTSAEIPHSRLPKLHVLAFPIDLPVLGSLHLHLRATLAVDKTGTGGLDHFNNTTTQMSTCFFAS